MGSNKLRSGSLVKCSEPIGWGIIVSRATNNAGYNIDSLAGPRSRQVDVPDSIVLWPEAQGFCEQGINFTQFFSSNRFN